MNKKTSTVTIQDKNEMVGFIRSLGTECRFVSMVTETPVKMRKTGNPFASGVIKVSRRNGLINVNYVAAVERNLAEANGGNKVEYIPGEVWYTHAQTDDGKALPLCVHKKDVKKHYLQYFPHKTLGRNDYYFNGVKMTPEQVVKMKTFVQEDNRAEYKPTVITLGIDSIRVLKARRVQMKNNLVSRITNRLATFKNVPANIEENKPAIAA
jgi:hypothetical protein